MFPLKFSVCLIFVWILFVSANEEEWKKFKMKLGTKYSASEESRRKELFLKADQKILQHNNGNHTWKMKHSPFSVMTEKEKQKYYGHLPPESNESLKSRTITKNLFKSSLGSDRMIILPGLPKSVDLRNDPCMSPVRNQGSCGSCWVFAAIQPIEFASCKNRGNKLILLSENFVKDCTFPKSSNHNGCQGGFEATFYDVLISNSTLRVPERSKYPPYQPSAGECQYTDDMKVEDTQVIDWIWVKGGTKPEIANNMLEILNNNITIVSALHVPSDWSAYGSGVYTNTTDCDLPQTHGVVIVGYGTMDSIDYWIIRNSWGDWWGDKGYVKMRRGVNQCRIEAAPLIPILA